MTTIIAGTDPEVFLSIGDKFVSAAGLFPGTKKEPYEVEKGAIQVDGLALEFNIDPAETAEIFDENIETVLKQMREMVSKVDKDMKINFTPIAKFDVQYFNDLPEDTKILGCDPDFSASNGNIIQKSKDITNIPIRSAAGHFHLGWTKDEDAMSSVHFEDARFVASEFYFDRANPFKAKTQEEFERLQYYGNHGAFRPKSYGVELRMFSNLWVEHSKDRKKMFNYAVNKTQSLYKGS